MIINNKDFVSKLCNQLEIPNYGTKVSSGCKDMLVQMCDNWNNKGYNAESDVSDGGNYQQDFASMISQFNYCSVTPSLERMKTVKSCYYQQILTSLNLYGGRIDVHEGSDYQGTTDAVVLTSVTANTMTIPLVYDFIVKNPESHWEANKACLAWAWSENPMLYDNGQCTPQYPTQDLNLATILFDGCMRMYFGFDSDIPAIEI